MKKRQTHTHNCHPACRECDLIYCTCQENIKLIASSEKGGREWGRGGRRSPKSTSADSRSKISIKKKQTKMVVAQPAFCRLFIEIQFVKIYLDSVA